MKPTKVVIEDFTDDDTEETTFGAYNDAGQNVLEDHYATYEECVFYAIQAGFKVVNPF